MADLDAACKPVFPRYRYWRTCVVPVFGRDYTESSSAAAIAVIGVSVEREIQLFVAVNFLVIGLSHLFQRDAWIEFFAKLHSLGRLGPFAEGFLYLNFGALIVTFHNVWTFPEVLLTLIGWTQVLKALLRFVAPEVVLRVYERMRPERAWQIQAAGGFLLAISAFCMFTALRRSGG